MAGVPVAVVVALVVFLLLLAAVCGVIAICSILQDLRESAPATCVVQVPLVRAPVHSLAPPLPRRLVHASPTALVQEDEEDDDYTEVELGDGPTTVLDLRNAPRR